MQLLKAVVALLPRTQVVDCTYERVEGEQAPEVVD